MATLPLGGSLERRLPLLMSALLAVLLGASLLVTYRTISRNAEGRARDRLASAVRQVGASIEDELANRASIVRETGRAPAVHAALVRGDTAGVGETLLRSATAPGDSLPVALWDTAGRTIARTRPRDVGLGAPFTPAQLIARTGKDEHDGSHRSSRTTFSPLFVANGSIRFVAVSPVYDNDRVIGYVTQERRITGPAAATQRFRDLTGEVVSLLIGNVDGSVWTIAPGRVVASPTSRVERGDELTWRRGDPEELMAVTAPVRGAPWIVALDTPLWTVRARTRTTLVRLGAVSLLLLAIGAGLAWLIGRRLTEPLMALTAAAEAIARGDVPRQSGTSARPRNELDRLASSFDVMAREISSSRRELEQRVHDAHATAEALEESNRRLAEAIAEAERARSEAENANSAKGDFLAVMSHELRTPLNAIAGYTQLLDLGVFGEITAQQRDALGRITRSGTHLLSLITDLLNFAKIDAGQMSYAMEETRVQPLLADIETLVAPQLRQKHQQYRFDATAGDPVVRVDPEKLRQIVLNLVTNSIKFTPAGGSITLACAVEADEVCIRVRDTGIGIRADRLADMYEPFVQGDRALNNPSEGIGLGLSIARELTTAMGGTLDATSQVNEGTSFTVRFPLVRSRTMAH